MGLKKKIDARLKQAMKDREAAQLSTLRLVNAAIKDAEIARRSAEEGVDTALTDADVVKILAKMLKQRQESARAYEEAGRLELAERERAEIALLEEFLPKPLTDKERAAAIDAAIAETGASNIRDMGRVMGALKAGYAGRMDFSEVGPEVREKLV